MKTELEPQDIEAIAKRVVELLKPILSSNGKNSGEDTIFDKEALADYLRVKIKWIYEQTHLKTIPFIKMSNKQLRFKKSHIDKWLDTIEMPATDNPTGIKSLMKVIPKERR